MFFQFREWSHRLVLICATVVSLLTGASAFGQGFMVKPMKMEVSGRPGDRLEIPLDLTNTSPDAEKGLELSLVEVTQSPDGSWMPVEKGVSVDLSKLSSCVSWVKLESNSVMVPASQTGRDMVYVTIPPDARGFNFAGIIAQTALPKDAKGVRVVMRFLIPLIVEIQGRPERQKIEFGDVGLTLLPKQGAAPANAAVVVPVSNEGRTYPRVKGNVKVSYLAKDRWLNLTSVELRDTGIIPASQLRIPGDIGKSLPSGKYKLLATLSVDGRRMKPVEREVEFEGDPSVTKVSVDTAMLLEPAEIDIAGTPGAMRAMNLKVQNASEDTVRVSSASVMPQPMIGGAYGDVKGEDYSCASWVEMVPAEFTLRPGAKQNVRVIAKVPADFSKPSYFAKLALKGEYEDGQSAGETQSLVCVENKKATPHPAAEIMKVGLSAGDPGKYIIQAKFANIGDSRFGPSAKVAVLGPNSQAIVESEVSGLEAAMLPLENRTGSAELDFAKVPDGTHILRTTLTFGDNLATADSFPVHVSTEDGQKVVTVVDTKTATSQPAVMTAPAANAQ